MRRRLACALDAHPGAARAGRARGSPPPSASAAPAPSTPPSAEPAPVAAVAVASPDASPPPRACPEGEVAVPPTPAEGFVMSKGRKGAHHVVLTHSFCMDQNEVTVRDYARCVEAGACKEPWRGDPYSTYPSHPDEPVNLVSWPKAQSFCAWAGKRLPTEAEWEWAATGPEQSRYPWGNEPEPSCDTCDYTKFGAPKWEAGGDIGCGGGGPSPVGSHPKGDRALAGRGHPRPRGQRVGVGRGLVRAARQRSRHRSGRAPPRPRSTPSGAAGWNRSYAAMVVTYRGAAHYSYQVPALGFRCVRGEPLPTPSPHYE